MFTPILDSSKRRPLYEQLYRYIRGEIEAGRLAAGERLPSKRALAAHLKISVVTVEGAYGQLLAEGYLRFTEEVEKEDGTKETVEKVPAKKMAKIVKRPVAINDIHTNKYNYIFEY